jgi:hypothetical protein
VAFDFFEVVRVEPRRDAPSEIKALRGRTGCILGKSAEEGQEPTIYAVDLDGVEEGWSIDARDLVSTGGFRRREDYYDGSSIRVSPAGELRSSYQPRRFAQVTDGLSVEVLSFVVLGHWRHANGNEQWCLDYLDDAMGEVRDDDCFASEEEAVQAANREFDLEAASWQDGWPGSFGADWSSGH